MEKVKKQTITRKANLDITLKVLMVHFASDRQQFGELNYSQYISKNADKIQYSTFHKWMHYECPGIQKSLELLLSVFDEESLENEIDEDGNKVEWVDKDGSFIEFNKIPRSTFKKYKKVLARKVPPRKKIGIVKYNS